MVTLFVALNEKIVVFSQVLTVFENIWNACFSYWKVFVMLQFVIIALICNTCPNF